ncbi:hypothetical protein AMTR_s00057p00115180 [Amborella trichopoda]|uniref:Uncharacterized protein n=1 Tax=Amborella trichopoda TaxID=13333 RepID=U5D5W9_AMBTC|nr:hypothetical protein AMTR_s00057p00115180 [Amborella trichopoda]
MEEAALSNKEQLKRGADYHNHKRVLSVLDFPGDFQIPTVMLVAAGNCKCNLKEAATAGLAVEGIRQNWMELVVEVMAEAVTATAAAAATVSRELDYMGSGRMSIGCRTLGPVGEEKCTRSHLFGHFLLGFSLGGLHWWR